MILTGGSPPEMNFWGRTRLGSLFNLSRHCRQAILMIPRAT